MNTVKSRFLLSAFTLIELLVTIAIIGLLAGFIYAGIIQTNLKAKCSRIKEDFQTIGKAAKFEWIITKVWASDVGTGVPPSFVSSGQLAQWPKASFYQKNINIPGLGVYDAMYDWERWPTSTFQEAGAIKSISLRAPNPTKRVSDPNGYNNLNPQPFDEEFYYCVQDDRAIPNNCYWSIQKPPTAVNVGGNCPVQ